MSTIDSKHIHSAFDEDLKQLNNLVMTMGGLVEDSIRLSSKALKRHDDERAERVVIGDAQIDALGEEISIAAVNIIALRQPQALDLRTVVAVIKIAITLERVGDYAKNIARRTLVLNPSSAPSTSGGSVRRLSKAVLEQIKESLDAFIQKNAEKATDLIERDEDIDQMYNALFREFLTHMMEDPRNITPSMHYLFIAKNLERMGDHATSIAEQVIYLVTGQLPADARTKSVELDF